MHDAFVLYEQALADQQRYYLEQTAVENKLRSVAKQMRRLHMDHIRARQQFLESSLYVGRVRGAVKSGGFGAVLEF
jgi:hypothetical protein